MASQQTAFEKRERAAEEVWFRQEEQLAMLKRLEALVDKGRLNRSVLDEVRKATSPDVHHASGVQVSPGVYKDVPGELKHKSEYVYAHAPGTAPPPKLTEAERMRTGVHVDLGPSKWSPGGEGGASIFSLSQALAEEAPPKNLPPHELARLQRLAKSAGAVDVPQVFGYKLMPGLTPGRAMFWGSVLAIWGTAALVAASARGMGPGPRLAEEGAGVHRETSALGERLAAFFMPWRERFNPPATPEERAASAAREHGEFVKRLKEGMVAGGRA